MQLGDVAKHLFLRSLKLLNGFSHGGKIAPYITKLLHQFRGSGGYACWGCVRRRRLRDTGRALTGRILARRLSGRGLRRTRPGDGDESFDPSNADKLS